MITRKNEYAHYYIQKNRRANEDGEVIDSLKVDVLTCWAEVQRTSVKDFKAGGKKHRENWRKRTKTSRIFQRYKKCFLVRYMPKTSFRQLSMYVNFNGFEYKITEIEVDYASKDIIMIKRGTCIMTKRIR